MFGKVIATNCSQTPLAGDAVFTGEWTVSDIDHIGINLVTDQDGTLEVDFAIVKDGTDTKATITDDDVKQTFSSATSVYADVGYFRTLVNLPGRAFRVRYTNGSVAQSEFYLHVAAGESLFPPSGSDDNEILTTVTERERSVFAAVSSGDITADAYRGFIDLSNTSGLPHSRNGRIDLCAVYLSVDRDATATGSVRIGVITRIDGTDSDIEYVQGVTSQKSDERFIKRDRVFSPNQLKCGVESGSLTKVASQFTETGVTAVNTGTSLTDANGTSFNPAVGDLIIKFSRGAGTYSSAVSCFYHGERST